MSDVVIGMSGLLTILLLILFRLPISISLGFVSFLGLTQIIGFNSSLSLVGRVPFDFAANWTFTAVPTFLLMGTIAFYTGLTANLFHAARLWLGFLPGGLAVATNFACAGFGAASGSSLATTVAMGRLAIPEMTKYKYDPGLACAVCCCSGTLGALIPPSIMMVMYGIFAEQSISKLFIAGILPGLLTAFIYALMIILRCSWNKDLAPRLDERPTMQEKISALLGIWPLLVLITLVMGGIYLGFTTPTEAGSIGVVAVLLLAAYQRRLTVDLLMKSLKDAAVSTAGIFFIALGAILLTKFMTFSGVPVALAEIVNQYSVSPLLFIIMASVLYLILGMFLDPLGILLVSIPILMPLLQSYEMNLIWFGVIAVKYIEIGLMTPPVGMNVFAVKSLVGEDFSLVTIFKGVFWFLGAEAVIMVLLIAFPQISLFLPSLM
ncbi:TRAP transporter large permease [Actibacterium sp.]|uniref:TRAP transporter large permease n=1 Tax=Actibacterium sp. TaxID=1872125 RepID=UPI0035674D9A